jgi:hypothetical protein
VQILGTRQQTRKGRMTGPRPDGFVLMPVEQMASRVGHVQQLFVFGFDFLFDVARSCLETIVDGV